MKVYATLAVLDNAFKLCIRGDLCRRTQAYAYPYSETMRYELNQHLLHVVPVYCNALLATLNSRESLRKYRLNLNDDPVSVPLDDITTRSDSSHHVSHCYEKRKLKDGEVKWGFSLVRLSRSLSDCFWFTCVDDMGIKL